MDSEGGAAPQASSGGETSAPDAPQPPAEASTAPQSQGATPSKRRNSTGKFPGGDAAGVAAAVAAAASAGIPLVEKVHAPHDEKGADGNAPPARIRRGSFKGTFGTDERKIDVVHHEGPVVHSYQDPSTSTLSSKGGAVMGGVPTIPRRRRASHGMGTLYAAATHSNSAVASEAALLTALADDPSPPRLRLDSASWNTVANMVADGSVAALGRRGSFDGAVRRGSVDGGGGAGARRGSFDGARRGSYDGARRGSATNIADVIAAAAAAEAAAAEDETTPGPCLGPNYDERTRRGSFKASFGTAERKIETTASKEGPAVHSYQENFSSFTSKGGPVMGAAPTLPRQRRDSVTKEALPKSPGAVHSYAGEFSSFSKKGGAKMILKRSVPRQRPERTPGAMETPRRAPLPSIPQSARGAPSEASPRKEANRHPSGSQTARLPWGSGGGSGLRPRPPPEPRPRSKPAPMTDPSAGGAGRRRRPKLSSPRKKDRSAKRVVTDAASTAPLPTVPAPPPIPRAPSDMLAIRVTPFDVVLVQIGVDSEIAEQIARLCKSAPPEVAARLQAAAIEKARKVQEERKRMEEAGGSGEVTPDEGLGQQYVGVGSSTLPVGTPGRSPSRSPGRVRGGARSPARRQLSPELPRLRS